MTILSVYINLNQGNKIEEELRKSANLSPEELAQLVAATKVESKEKKEKDEEVQFKGFLENSPSREKLLFADYQKLLKLTRLAYVREQNGVPEEHAIKLLEAFGNYEAAIEYLTKYEKSYPSRRQLIHDACLFALPSDKYNVELWQQLNQKHMPNERYEKTLSLAPEIESFVLKHQQELENLAEQEIRSGHETRLGDEWERAQKEKETQGDVEYTQKKKKRLEKKITEMVDKQFSNKAFKKIQAEPENFKGLDTLEALKKFRESDEGKKLRKVLTDTITAEQEALQEEYEKTQLSANVAKQDYIKNKLDDPKLQKIIEGNIKDAKSRILSKQSSIETLYGYLSQCSYKNAGQNPKAAALFFEYGLSQKQFDKYLALKISKTSNIPDVFIDGTEIGYPGFYLKKLSKTDPTCAIAGKMTSCCQWMGGAGGACAIHAITSPNGDIYGLYQKRGKNPGEDDILLAQTWAWLSKNNNIVFDSIESQIDFRRKNDRMLSDFFVLLTHKLVKEKGIPNVFLGLGESPEELTLTEVPGLRMEKHKDYAGYSDAAARMSNISSPIFLRFYLEQYSDSKLNKILHDIPQPKKEDFLEWVTIDKSKELLQIAIKEGNVVKVRYLIENVWPDVNDFISFETEETPTGIRPIHIAAEHNQEDIAKFLLDKKANLVPDNKGKTVLHLTSNLNLMDTFIKMGADINAEDIANRTPLYMAIERGSQEQVDFLLNRGAKLNKGRLSLEAARGNIEMVKYLIGKGCDINMKSSNLHHKGTILHSSINLDVSQRLSYIQFLVKDLKMDINAPGYWGNTVFSSLAQLGNLEEMQSLLDYGADIDSEDNEGHTPLSSAMFMSWKQEEKIKFLLDHGADIYRKNKKGISVIDRIQNDPKNFNENIVNMILAKDKELQKELKAKEDMHLPAYDLAKDRVKPEEGKAKSDNEPKRINRDPKNP